MNPGFGHRGSALIVLALPMACLVAGGCGGSSKSSSGSPPENSTEQLVAKVRSGIIRIETSTCDGQFVGTGFLVGPRLVATVEHVVDGASQIVLKRKGHVLASGKIVGEDVPRDLALVETAKPLAGYRFRLASRSPRLAEQVIALGFPFGLPLTVTQGAVSGLGRSIPITSVTRRQLVQTDAALNPGNSGGPLLATDTGQVVGLVDLGTQANGTSFAVSAAVAQPLLQAWQLAPQPVPADTCGALAAGGGGSPTQTSSSGPLAYVRQVARLLGNSASVRKQLVTAVSEASSDPTAARRDISAVVATRRDELSLAESMSTPGGAGDVQDALVRAFSLSLASDRLYQRWITSGSHALLDQAQANDVQTVRVKRSFLRLYNDLRLSVGLPQVPPNFPF